MPGGAGRPRRACPICKSHKYAGNGKERTKAKDRRHLEDEDDDYPTFYTIGT